MPQHPPPALDDPELAARAMLARKRRFLLAFFGNALLLVSLVGGPYARGLLRARAQWPRFADASACVFGGSAHPEPGLGVPRGHEQRFAARVISPPRGYPEDCDARLAQLAPDEAIFLLPWLKTAEYEVREATRLMREELRQVPRAGADARISTRPLRAYELLRAALARQALAAGLSTPPERLAFTFDQPATLHTPTRVPLNAASDAVLTLWGNDRRFEALGIDGTGLAYLSMEAGTLWPMRVPRPKLLQAFLPDDAGGVLIWAMAQARCRDRSDACTGKTLGLARVKFPVSQLPEPRWFASHPAGRSDRCVLALPDGWLVAASAAGGATAVREFAAPENSAGSNLQELPPLAPRATYAAEARGQVVLTRLANAPLVLNAAASEAETTLATLAASGERRGLATMSGADRAWLVACSANDRVRMAFGHDRALRMVELDAQGALSMWDELPMLSHSVVHDRDPARDRVQLLCGQSEPLALVLGMDGTLHALACAAGQSKCELHTLQKSVRGFAGLATNQGRALVAYAGSGEHAQVRLLELDAQGRKLGVQRTPAACWSDARGMCGAPRLERLGARIVLTAYEGSDLLALESADEGVSWEPLRGIRKQE